MELTGEQYRELTQALISAFPTPTKLRNMLRFRFNENLANIARDNNLENMVVELIGEFKAKNQILELVKGAREENPDNLDLESLENRLKEELGIEIKEQSNTPNISKSLAKAKSEIKESNKPVWVYECDVGSDDYGRYADLVVKDVKQRFRWIEAGEFWMGSPENEEGRWDNEARHKVHISKGFWLADTVCTQSLWKAIMGNNPSRFKGDNLPVERVSWEKATKFIVKINGLAEGSYFRLPTEAEWEYACRTGTSTPFAYGERASSKLMSYNGILKRTAPVNDAFQNEWGLFQMHGNVLEWCQDWYEDSYGNSGVFGLGKLIVDPCGPDTGTHRVLRGGSWANRVRSCRSAYRAYYTPLSRRSYVGFRLVSGHQYGNTVR